MRQSRLNAPVSPDAGEPLSTTDTPGAVSHTSTSARRGARGRRWHSAPEAARLLGVTRQHIGRLARAGELAAWRGPDGTWRICAEALEDRAGRSLDETALVRLADQIGDLDAALARLSPDRFPPAPEVSILDLLGDLRDEVRALSRRIDALSEPLGTSENVHSRAGCMLGAVTERTPDE